MQPAQLLGGDYYDFYKISEEVVDVVIADVSGHGAAASLLMPSLAVALRLRARELDGPAAIIKDLDGVFRQITNAATFVTMFYARFDQSKKTLQYANGGHNPPLLVRPKTGETLLLDAGGPIMGILPQAQFSNTVVALIKATSSPFLPMASPSRKMRLVMNFRSSVWKKSCAAKKQNQPSALVTQISEAVSTFAGTKQQVDDLTVVVVKVL